MIRARKFSCLLFLLIFFVLFSFRQIDPFIPITGNSDSPTSNASEDTSKVITISEFVDTIKDGNKSRIRGIYADNLFALKVVQQPTNDYSYVSLQMGQVTQFALAAKYNTIGFLAHNFLSGRLFLNLKMGDAVQVIFGDGNIEQFFIKEILQFQALQPNSPRSSFKDLKSNSALSAEQLFRKIYTGERHVVLQTCLEKDGIDTWGRAFILAYPTA
jgi:hypothetical protein